MNRELRIELLDFDFLAFIKANKNLSPPPDGVRIEGPKVRTHASTDAPDVATFITLSVVLPIALNLLTSYLHDYFTKNGTKRIRIEKEEILTVDKDRLQHVIRTKLEIDQ